MNRYEFFANHKGIINPSIWKPYAGGDFGIEVYHKPFVRIYALDKPHIGVVVNHNKEFYTCMTDALKILKRIRK